MSESQVYKKWQTSAIILEISDSNLESGRYYTVQNLESPGLSRRVDSPLKATSLQRPLHTTDSAYIDSCLKPLYNDHFFSVPKVTTVERFNCISNYWWLQMSTTPKNYHSVFKWTLMGYLSVWLLCKWSFGSSQNRMSVWTFITIQCHTGC